MNATSFKTFFTSMLRYNVVRILKLLFAAFKRTKQAHNTPLELQSFEPWHVITNNVAF